MNREQFLTWCVVKRGLAKSSIKHTRIRYDLLYRWLGKRELTPDTAESFVLYLREKGLRNASLNSYIRVINLIDIYERENGYDKNLLKKIAYFKKQKKVPTILSYDEIESMLTVRLDLKKRNGSTEEQYQRLAKTYNLFIWMLAATGARYSEVQMLKKENLKLGTSEGYVEFKDTKTNEDRNVPLPPILIVHLNRFITLLKPGDHVFTSTLDNPIAEQTFNPMLRKTAEAAGLSHKHIYAHCFRNSYIMEHIRRGTQLLTISKLVGHRSADTTLGYTKYNYDDILKGAENHPMFTKTISEHKILDKLKEAIHGFRLQEDTRFEFEVLDKGHELSFRVAIKKAP